jgi:vancomycin resistance protein VanW
LTHPGAFAAPLRSSIKPPNLLYSTRISLRSNDPDAHAVFEAGKKHNVTLAAPAFHGLLLTPTRPFSFWRTLGRVTRSRGYREGMELAGGCIVPAVGGGLCLLARVLFQAALYCDFEILERHGHSLMAVEPPPGVPWGIDASILWPYVDLRFAPRSGSVWIGMKVQHDALIVTVHGSAALEHRVELHPSAERVTDEHEGRVRWNRILRRKLDEAGRFVSQELVATNRSRVLERADRQRNCLTCNEHGCTARVVLQP